MKKVIIALLLAVILIFIWKRNRSGYLQCPTGFAPPTGTTCNCTLANTACPKSTPNIGTYDKTGTYKYCCQ